MCTIPPATPTQSMVVWLCTYVCKLLGGEIRTVRYMHNQLRAAMTMSFNVRFGQQAQRHKKRLWRLYFEPYIATMVIDALN